MTLRDDRSDATEARRLEAVQRLGVAGTTRVGELDPFLELVAIALGARSVAFTAIDQDVARVLGEIGEDATVQLGGRWSVARDAVDAADGRSVWTVGPGQNRARRLVFDGSGAPVTMAAVAVAGAGGQRVGAVVATWVAEVVVPDAGWEALASAAEHVTTILELRAEVAEYRRFVALNPQPLLVLDDEGDIEVANPAAVELLAASGDEELRGRSFLELVADHDVVRVAQEISRVLFSPRHHLVIDATLTDARGEELVTSLAVGYLRGVRSQLQVAVHDMTARLGEEESRTQLLEQLARAQRLDAVGQVAGGLAHDLNNLLAVLDSNLSLALGSVDRIEAEPDADGFAELRADLGELATALTRAGALTSQMLEFARRRPGGEPTTDVGEVIDGLVRLITPSLAPQVRLTVDVAEGLPPVGVDPVHFERALLNLVNNARDALDGAGSITLRAVAAHAASPVGDRRRGDAVNVRQAVRVEVADDGSGMDAVTRARAFEPLFTTKPDGRGSGLGLPSVLAFAAAADADLHLRSNPGQGTTVKLTLPVTPTQDGGPGEAAGPGGGARVLLVEPGEHARRVIVQMLVAAGYRVTAAGSGEEALADLEREAVDLLVTDLVLPATSGHRLIADARQLRPEIGVVVLSSVEAPRVLEGDPVLVKPFSQTRLLRTVSRVLEGR